MDKSTVEKIGRMTAAAEQWLHAHRYHYMECNYVPARFFTKNRRANLLLRTFFRLCPFNLRSKKDIAASPFTPHATVAMLKAFAMTGKSDVVKELLDRSLRHLKSPATKAFSLRQGIRIAVNLYEDSGDDPTPLNTVLFGEYLLSDTCLDRSERERILLSICDYLINELGYRDFGAEGIYFYYGHNLTDIIYNASAIISSFLIKCGCEFGRPEFTGLGRRGLEFIVRSQNPDGSWYYYGPPLKKAIDGFHQSYILRALIEAEGISGINLRECIERGTEFYKTQFAESGSYLIPQRYDKRFNPKNTWLLQQIDGRDMTEALTFFSLYEKDERRVEKLVNYMYDKLYRKDGRFVPEIFIYGRNRNDYIEFYAWYLHALLCVRNSFCKE